MKIVISSGHGKYIRGASGSPVPPQLDEVDEARKVVETVANMWREMGVQVVTFHDDTSHDQNTNLNTIVNFHNSQTRDLDVSVHFNAYDGSAHGVECLYVTQESLAGRVANGIASCGFVNRGAKYRSDLFFLNNTEMPAILIETCFCDNTGDSNRYNDFYMEVCQAIAEAISGQEVDEPGERPPIEWRPDPPDRPVPEEENRLVMTIQGYGDLVVNINGQRFVAGDDPDNCPVVNLTMECPEHSEDLTVQINGQDYHGPFGRPPAATNHDDVTATVFGGAEDDENSAYDGQYLDDDDLYVAVPANVPDKAMRDRGIRVYNRDNGKSAVGKVRDKGPWMVDDDAYVFGTDEAISVVCYREHRPLPRGPNAGKVPTNDAAFDISPALSRAIGIDGKGKVDWEWVV